MSYCRGQAFAYRIGRGDGGRGFLFPRRLALRGVKNSLTPESGIFVCSIAETKIYAAELRISGARRVVKVGARVGSWHVLNPGGVKWQLPKLKSHPWKRWLFPQAERAGF